MSQSRRNFLKTAAAAGAAGAAAVTFPNLVAPGKVLGANERFRMGVCGLNGRGGSHMGSFSGIEGVEVSYVCDPDSKVLDRKRKGLQDKVGDRYEVQGVSDVRRILEDKKIDAISIATPNHWHSLMTIWGAQAGKHVYVEKPASHDVFEGRIATEAWKKYGVVIQHGTQNRSDPNRAGLHQAIQAGKWGKLKIAYGYCCKPRSGIGFNEPKDPPAHLDWNLWRGPAKIKEYHDNYVHYDWHWFWETGNGDLNNQGTHQLDVAQWAIDPDQTHPVRAMALGGRFNWKDQGVTPNSMFGMVEYPNGQYVMFNVRNVNYKGYQRQVDNEYYFEDGGRITPWGPQGGLRYYPKGSQEGEPVKVPPGNITGGGNFKSFITAARAGDQMKANGNMDQAHHSCVVGHLMNNSYRIGEELPFNEKAGRFGDNKDAYEHFMKLHSVMRDGCGVPEDKAKYTVGPMLSFDPKTERFTGDRAADANKLLRDPNRRGFRVPDITAI